MPNADYLSERIRRKVGMESGATWWLELPDDLEVGGSGLSATLRDYGRFGLFLLNHGVAGDERILFKGWVGREGEFVEKLSTVSRSTTAPCCGQFDSNGTPNESACEARGIFGQHVWVNPRANAVIVVWGAAQAQRHGTDQGRRLLRRIRRSAQAVAITAPALVSR